ncbi:MAG: hypothetical protein DMF88_11960 [Acidobacteria bacterium]|nr:MAG: hypothetical protein DMF88_11960 [Acidobacteriota bacterium]
MADHDPKVPATTSRKADANAKKPFEAPRLTVYGDIATLTRTVGRTGIDDGGHGSNTRTRP